MQRDLDGASILVAGASGGMGSAISRQLAKQGAQLVLLGRDAARLGSLDVPGTRVELDLRDAGAGTAAVDAALEAHGRLDGVVNAAGVVAFGDVEDLDDEVLDELLAVNLVGPIRLVRAALPHLTQGGFVANLSAIVAEQPTGGMAAYSATKAALSAFDRALTRELRRRRIDVIDIRPPHTETGLAQRPIAGEPPRLGEGLPPDRVASRIVDAIRSGERELGSTDFS